MKLILSSVECDQFPLDFDNGHDFLPATSNHAVYCST